MRHTLKATAATLTLAASALAGEDDHGETDAFLADAASLLPVHSIVAQGVTANAQVQTPADKATYGEWGSLMSWPFIPVTAANLPDGRIVTFASNERTRFPVGPEFTYAGVWDPTTGQHTEINHETHDMFCAAPAMGIDGNPIFPGGRNSVRFTSIFDYQNDQWIQVEDMHDGRWYASSTTLANGSIVTASGSRGTGINTVERYTLGSGWTRLAGVPWDGVTTKAFPYNFVAPDGRIFSAGPASVMHWIDPVGNGQITPTTAVFPGNRINQSGGVAMYDVGKILFAGGGVSGGGTTNVAHTVDINSPTPVVTAVASMQFSRRFHNALMLPDGKAIMIGGNTSGLAFNDSGTVYAPEMWDPDTDTWSELADMAKPRNYHSVALMLPDGRVFSGGGGLSSNTATNHQDAQIFSPPYLFNPDGSAATRPAITSAPGVTSPGSTIQVQGSTSIDRFTMIRMTATTHAFTSDVRFLEIPHSVTAPGQFDLTMHANVNVLIPGYWMLFGLNSQGTPSEASIIKVSTPSPPDIAQVGDQHTLLGHLVSLPLVAGDADGDALTFSASGLPNGLQIDPSTGTISGRPLVLGQHAIDVTVTDGTTPVSTSFTWTVSQDPGLISYWPFDEGSGTIANDLGGTGADGTLQNGTTWTPGLQGEAVSFGGDDENIIIPNDPALEVGDNGADFSVSFWINLRQQSSLFGTIIHKGDQPGHRTFAVWLYPDSRKLFFGVSTTANSSEAATSNGELPMNQWAHVALVKEGGDLSLYLDGELDRLIPLVGTTISNTGAIRVGDDPWWGGVNAYMDELAIYGRALTTSEVNFMADASNRIIGANTAPEITNPGPQSSPLSAVSLMVDASDANGDTLTYSDDGQLPPGLTLNPNSGLISGTPTTPGTYNPQITVSDGIESASMTFQWQIREQITASVTVPGPQQAGSSVNFTIAATGQNLSYEWNFGDGTAPQTSSTGTSNHVFAQPGRYTVIVTISDDLGQSHQISFHQSIHAALTANRPNVSQSLIYEDRQAANDRVWNVNPDNDSVSVFDVITDAKLAEIPVGQNPRALAIAPSGQIWVTNKGAATVSRIDPATLSVVSTIDLPRASQPHGIAFSPTGSSAFISLEAGGELIALDPNSGAQQGSVDVGDNPRHLSVNHDGAKVYVSRFITPPVTGEATAAPSPGSDEGGEIVVVTTANAQVSNTIILHNSTRPDSTDQGRGIPNYLGPAAISPDGSTAWVASKQDNVQRGMGRDGNPLTHDNTIRSITSRIDLASETEDPDDRVDHDNAGIGSTSLFGRYGNFVFSALEGSRHVTVTDVFNGIEIKRFHVERAPQGLAISPDGRTLFVHNFMSRSVTSHDVSELIDGTGEDVADLATYSTVASENLPANVLLGKQHFYDAQDTRLALQEYISCASCHNDGAQDGRVWDLTGFGEGLRNTIDLRGRAGLAHGPLHWSANFDEVQDFEGQIRNLSGGGGLIANGNPHPPLGSPNAGRSADLDALADYVGSLATFDDSPLRNSDGSLSSAAATGKTLFAAANCSSCHGGENFTDSAPGSLHDIGTLKATSGDRLGGLLSGIDAPTLRGVATSAPYLHDGSAGTIADAIAAHDSAATLTAAEIDQIADYLREIDGTEPAPPAAPGNDELSPDANTVALYHFNSDYTDASPNAFDLTASGGVALTSSNLGWMQSPSGKVARFSAIGDALSVNIPDSLVLPANGTPLLIEARIYARNYLGYSIDNLPIIAFHQEWDSHLQLEDSKWGTNPTGPKYFASGGVLASAQQWADVVTNNAWHRIQISYNGADTVKLWVDGILINSLPLTPNVDRSSDWTLTIGNFDGDIDELLISRSEANPAPDTTPPTVMLTTPSTSVTNSFSVTANFSENVTGLALGDFVISNGTASALSGSADSYTFTVTPSAQGTVGVSLPAGSVQDVAGNGNNTSNTLAIAYNPPTGGGDETAPTAQTIALYHLNDNFDDASSNGLDLSSSPGVALTDTNLGWMQNPSGKVARFSNVGDVLSVNIPDSLILPDSTAPITIEARIYPRQYLGYGFDNLPVIALHQDWDAHLQLEDSKWGTNPKGPKMFANGGVLANAQQWADAAPLNQWHLLQISYDGVGTVSTWIDGTPISAISVAPNAGRSSDWTLTLGNFDGDLDEIHIHSIPAPPGAPPVGSHSAVAAVVDAYNQSHGTTIALPLSTDSDGDGWIDLFEVAHGTSPIGAGVPDYHLNMTSIGGQTYPVYSIPVQSLGATTADGFVTAAFTYRIEASTDLVNWEEAIVETANPSDLPAAPAGYQFITFRSVAPSAGQTFFRTTVIENP